MYIVLYTLEHHHHWNSVCFLFCSSANYSCMYRVCDNICSCQNATPFLVIEQISQQDLYSALALGISRDLLRTCSVLDYGMWHGSMIHNYHPAWLEFRDFPYKSERVAPFKGEVHALWMHNWSLKVCQNLRRMSKISCVRSHIMVAIKSILCECLLQPVVSQMITTLAPFSIGNIWLTISHLLCCWLQWSSPIILLSCS